jgi:hypothetical protein
MYPEYWLTHQPAADLIRTTNSWLYSTEWTDWLDPATKEILQVRNDFGPLAGQFITNHEIDPTNKDIHRVTYEDGTQVVINHGSDAYSGAYGPVSAYSYVIRKGGSR